MAKYEVQLNYNAQFIMTVEAQDEGQAYSKVREMAEESSMNHFTLGVERESVCNCIDH